MYSPKCFFNIFLVESLHGENIEFLISMQMFILSFIRKRKLEIRKKMKKRQKLKKVIKFDTWLPSGFKNF